MYISLKDKTKLIRSWGVALLCALLLLPLVPAQAEEKTVIEKMRFGRHNDAARVVLETSKPLQANHFALLGPSRYVLDFKNITFKADTAHHTFTEGSLVQGVRQGLFKPGVTRMVLDVSKPAVATVFTIPASSEHGHRMVIDLKPATSAEVKKIEENMRRMASLDAKEVPVIREKQEPRKVGEFVVVLDPGHGGVDPGAISRHGVYEKDIVLQIAQKVQENLKDKEGIKVYLTRSTDIFVPLKERVRIAQEKQADLFVSIHADSHVNPAVRGGSVYVLSDKSSDKEAARLARIANEGDRVAGMDLKDESTDVRNILIDLTQRETMNKSALLGKEVLKEMQSAVMVHKKEVLFAGFRVLKAVEVPSILVETSYVSNPLDVETLTSVASQKKLATAIAGGVESYIRTHAALSRRAMSGSGQGAKRKDGYSNAS